MNLYLDIDGVLVKDGKPANGLREFLEFATEHHNCYWLTTHCRSGGNRVNEHLKNFLSSEILNLTRKIQPRDWITFKTEAIDFKKSFLWLDYCIFDYEKDVLLKNSAMSNLQVIDLVSKPNQLLEILEMLKKY
mgnify:CR=1 FL=1